MMISDVLLNLYPTTSSISIAAVAQSVNIFYSIFQY